MNRLFNSVHIYIFNIFINLHFNLSQLYFTAVHLDINEKVLHIIIVFEFLTKYFFKKKKKKKKI